MDFVFWPSGWLHGKSHAHLTRGKEARRRQRQEVYIPLIHRPGKEAQADFFEVVAEVNGQ